MDPPHSAEILSIPTHSSGSTTLRCCCGRNDCALLEHNNVALEGLEKDLETAARLGQVRILFEYSFSKMMCCWLGMTIRQAVPRLAEPCMFDCLIHHSSQNTLYLIAFFFTFALSFIPLGLHILHTLCRLHIIWKMASLRSRSPILSHCVGVRHGYLS